MDKKIRIIMLVIALGTMCVGELIILSAQDSTGSAAQQTQTPNDTSKGQALTQTQTPNDTIGENSSTGIRILGISIEPTIRLDVFLGVIVALISVIVALLGFIFGTKTRSKSPPELTIEVVSKPENASIEVVSKPENASEVEEYIRAIERNPKATFVEKAIADAYVLQRSEKIKETIEKWLSIANIAEGHDKVLTAQAWQSAGFLYINERMGKEALSALDKALDLKPDSAEIYNGRGIAEFMLGNYHNALTDCDEAIRLKPDYAEAYNTRGGGKTVSRKVSGCAY